MFFFGAMLLVAILKYIWHGTDYDGLMHYHVYGEYSDSESKEDSKIALGSVISGLEANMVSIHGGSFKMGCTPEQGKACDNDEFPVHEVTLSNFHIAKYEVTQEEWKAVMGSNPSHFKGCPKCPVENVSWNDTQKFIQALNQKTGKQYRLPTEAEWEYAARGGKKSKGNKYSGAKHNLSSVGWYSANSGDSTKIVGIKRPNELGLYDMSGNVYEWCNDWYDSTYYTNSSMSNPVGPSTGKSKVFRGGAWYFIDWINGNSNQNDLSQRGKNDVDLHRVSYRNGYVPSFNFYFIGFRLCRT